MLKGIAAWVRALLPADWSGRPGARFRERTASIAEATREFVDKHDIRPSDVLDEGVELGRRKLRGLANKEYAAAVKDFAEAEEKKISAELQRRSLESKVRKEEAEARLAEIKTVDAEFELISKLARAGVTLYRSDTGPMSVIPLPPNCSSTELAERLDLRLEESNPVKKE
jgi:hypothetical protein